MRSILFLLLLHLSSPGIADSLSSVAARADKAALDITMPKSTGKALALAAEARVGVTLYYDAAYVRDVPEDRGVCSDVVLRAYAGIGKDLRTGFYRDRKANLKSYPKLWASHVVDRNIDHRRVPNLLRYFERKAALLKLDDRVENYLPGDLVVWNLGAQFHIGVVSTQKKNGRPLIVHNIAAGTKLEDVINSWPKVAHIRY